MLNMLTNIETRFESAVNSVFFWIIWFFELVAVLIIVCGALYSLYKYIKSIVTKTHIPLKMMLANQLGLGLEFMLVAEILKTVITAHGDIKEILMLAVIVLLRAALSVLLHWEVKTEEKIMDVSEKKEARKSKNL